MLRHTIILCTKKEEKNTANYNVIHVRHMKVLGTFKCEEKK